MFVLVQWNLFIDLLYKSSLYKYSYRCTGIHGQIWKLFFCLGSNFCNTRSGDNFTFILRHINITSTNIIMPAAASLRDGGWKTAGRCYFKCIVTKLETWYYKDYNPNISFEFEQDVINKNKNKFYKAQFVVSAKLEAHKDRISLKQYTLVVENSGVSRAMLKFSHANLTVLF